MAVGMHGSGQSDRERRTVREPSAQGTVAAVRNRVGHPESTRYFRETVHARHISRHLSDGNTRPDAASAGPFVETLPQRSVPFRRGHADGSIGRHGTAGVCRKQPLDLGVCSSMLWPMTIFLQAREEAQWLD